MGTDFNASDNDGVTPTSLSLVLATKQVSIPKITMVILLANATSSQGRHECFSL